MTNNFNVSTSFTNSNYIDFGKDKNKSNFESLNTYNLSLQKGNLTTSFGLGVDTQFNMDSPGKRKNAPAIEAKVKYNITDNINAQARFRKIGDAEQYRVTFGGSYNFNKNNSIYTAAHLTTKHNDSGFKTNTGGWIGYTHKFGKCSLSAELQQNIPFNGDIQSNDTMVNIIASIPF